MTGDLHPALPFILGAVLVPGLGRWARFAGVLAPAVSLALLLLHSGSSTVEVALLGDSLHVVRIDALSRVFALAFIVFSFIANIFAWRAAPPRELAFALLLSAGGLGVVLAGDFASLLFSWEWLSIASVGLIWLGGTAAAQRAGVRYLLFHVAGGSCLFAGIVLEHSWLILAGFLVNAAVPPLHAWLPDAYPRASIFGSVWLTAFTTKSAVYALARHFPGTELLVGLGAAMAIYGVVFALMENDLRRLLSYHVVSQVGFMVAGVGLGTELAINGASAHAFCHVFYKGLLMMAAAAVIHATGRSKLTELGGLARKLPLVLILFAVGAASISSVPLLSGFVSKSMTITAAASAGRTIVEIVLIVASVGTFLSIAAKITYFVFIAPGDVEVRAPVPRPMVLAMIFAALICVGLGVAPELLYRLLPHDVSYRPYTLGHVVEALQLACVSALGFWLFRAKLASAATITRDLDRVYVWAARAAVAVAGAAVSAAGGTARLAQAGLRRAYLGIRAVLSSPAANDAPVGLQVAAIAVASLGLVLLIWMRIR